MLPFFQNGANHRDLRRVLHSTTLRCSVFAFPPQSGAGAKHVILNKTNFNLDLFMVDFLGRGRSKTEWTKQAPHMHDAEDGINTNAAVRVCLFF